MGLKAGLDAVVTFSVPDGKQTPVVHPIPFLVTVMTVDRKFNIQERIFVLKTLYEKKTVGAVRVYGTQIH